MLSWLIAIHCRHRRSAFSCAGRRWRSCIALVRRVVYLPAVPIPSYPDIMRPLLDYLVEANRAEAYHPAVELNDICAGLAECFPKMTKEELENERLPANRQLKFLNRVGWAAFELKTAKLIISPSRAHYQITDRGMELIDVYVGSRIRSRRCRSCEVAASASSPLITDRVGCHAG